MPDIALDLRFLHYAILVARLGSFSAAAESSIYRTQPSTAASASWGEGGVSSSSSATRLEPTSPLPEPGSWRMPSAE